MSWFYSFDGTYWLYMIPGLIITIWAQAKVKSTFAKYNQVRTMRGYTGAQAARAILDASGLQHVAVERTQGTLTDHYDPSANVVRLSDATYSQPSVGAVGVAAHECGHAMQYAADYLPIRLRMAIIPICNIGSGLAGPLMLLGFLLNVMGLVTVGIILFSLVVFFQLVTLPVEFNASSRAVEALGSSGMVTVEENQGVRSVLTAAALTYVAALLSSMLQLLYYISRVRRSRR